MIDANLGVALMRALPPTSISDPSLTLSGALP